MPDTSLTASVSVCGAGHSGSTLLGMILGSHPLAFYAGEAAKVRYLGDATKPLRKRACKICGDDCPVWSRFEWDRDQGLYQQIAAHTGSPVVIDTSKDEAWITARTAEVRASGARPVLILLTRDGRAVVNSRLRKYPERDAEAQIRDWAEKMQRALALFAAHEGPKYQLSYEALATDPVREINALCDRIGLDYDPAMLDFAASEHHPLGGNNGTQYVAARERSREPDEVKIALTERTRGYYADHPAAIRLDLRWKSELSADHAALFERVAGHVNQPLKWEM